MKRHTLFVCLLTYLFTFSAHAQTPPADTSFYRPLEQYQLKPIVIGANGRYYYGGKRLRSSYSLEIPFGELDDPQVNRHFKNSRIIRTVGSVVSALPGIYFLLTAQNRRVSTQTFWITYFGSIGVSLGSTLLANHRMRRAVDVYNARLGRPRIGLSLQQLPGNRFSFGIGVRQSF